MLSDLAEGHEPLSLAGAARQKCLRRDGRGPSPATVYRWVSAGVGGARLEAARVGGSTCTTTPALLRFLARLNGQSPAPATPTPAQARRAHEAAERSLDRCGIR